MGWDEIVACMPKMITKLKKDYVVKNDVIRDDIFAVLEKHCSVIYYPLVNEDNCGFHVKRMMNGKLTDFVYINTAKPLSKQVFTAAHELGHVWNVAQKIAKYLRDDSVVGMEEEIVNRFAAELLMPTNTFVNTFNKHVEQIEGDKSRIRLDDFIKVMVLQMNDYMVTYESVRRRLVEVGIISEKTAEVLKNDRKEIDELIKAFSDDINTTLDTCTNKKTIPGLRDLIEEKTGKPGVSKYVILKTVKDFEVADIIPSDDVIDLESGGNVDV